MKSRVILSLYVVIVLTLMSIFVCAVQPFGAQTSVVDSERAPEDTAGNDTALAGNVTEMDIFGFSITQAWQGYFGNVTGTVQLADASDNVMYNWSLASPEGEVYACNESSIDWASVACFDIASNGVALEAAFGVATDDVDGVTETFSTGNGHDLFYTNNVEFTEGTCPSTQNYDDTGAGVDNHFEEVLLTDGSYATQVIFTSILDEEDVAGFDGDLHDFEMLVLEDGHGTDTSTTTYYFWVELE